MEDYPEGPLADLKVLDLAGPIGVYCTKLLADMSADVIRIEPPSGDSMRQRGPFYRDEQHPEKSLYWWHFNTSKRGITLDLEKPAGQELFKRLVQWADILVETAEPGSMDSLGLGFDVLHEINPGLIMASITPFGQTGPYSHYKGPDIVGQAMSGIMNSVGFADRAPYTIGSEIGYWSAATLAADAIMIAVAHRDTGGSGNHIDVSMQEAMALGLVGPFQYYDTLNALTRRGTLGPGSRSARWTYTCKDGWLYFMPGVVGSSMEAVRDLFTEYGYGDEFDPKWLVPNLIRTDPVEGPKFEALAERFFATFKKWELVEAAFKRDVAVFVVPADTPGGLVESPIMRTRDFFQNIEHPEIEKSIKYLGPPYRLPESPWRISRRAPLIGEHNKEVFGDILGLTEEAIQRLKETGVI